MVVLLVFVSCVLIVIVIISIWNVHLFPKLKPVINSQESIFVSILIPARNEAQIIGKTIQSLLAQTYSHFELLVMDDSSTDGTYDAVLNAAHGDARLRLFSGTPLPTGWTGKNHACHRLSQQAKGEILVFADADTYWHPEALAALLIEVYRSKADLLAVWPTQQTITWSERLVVPLMMFTVISYLPIWFVHYTRFSVFAAANGQCMVWKRSAYEKIGGHRSIANEVLDDVKLARRIKRNGYKLWMVQGNCLLSCRMYSDWLGVSHGYAKNILAGFGNSIPALLLATVFHWLVFILPWFWLLLPEFQFWAFCLVVLGIGVRALTAAASNNRVLDAVGMPVSVFLMTLIAIRSIYWHFTGGPRWKGRVIRVIQEHMRSFPHV